MASKPTKPNLVSESNLPSNDGNKTQSMEKRSNLVGRSNSAPQAQNQFTAFRNPTTCEANNKIQENGIQTLSDGIMNVSNTEAVEAAASVLSTTAVGQNNISSTPLCDSNHSPSSTRHYYNQVKILSQEPKPDDVWQRQDGYSQNGDGNMNNNNNISNNNNVNGGGVLARRVKSKSESKSCEFSLSSVSCEEDVGGENDSMNQLERSCGDGCDETVGCQTSYSTHPSLDADINNQGLHKYKSESVDSGVEMRKSSPRQQPLRRHTQSEIFSEKSRKMSVANFKEKGHAKLEEELAKAQRALALKDEEVDELRGIRERLMKEVSDFTASLFEEVNSQLNEAALAEQNARKQLEEANSKIEVLTAEVSALKSLVLTSTPSSPNKHLHPQIAQQSSKKEKNSKPFWKTHRRSTSHHQYTKESMERAEATDNHAQLKELDTGAFDEFSRWCLKPAFDFTGQFFARVLQEDVQPCLNFKNTKLSKQVMEGVEKNTLTIEPIPGDSSFPRKCSLCESHKLCNYKIKFEGEDEWYSISQMSRNRITAVCDFYAYVRYIVQGLVKSTQKDMFVQMVKLRHSMAQARLGLV